MGAMQSAKIGGTGGTPFAFTCPANAHITKFKGRSGAMLDGISATCSDGTASAYYGGPGGEPWEFDHSAGFIGVDGTGGKYVNGLRFTQADGVQLPQIGSTTGTAIPSFTCPTGYKLAGIAGGAGSLLDQVQFGCMPIAAKPDPPAPGPLPGPDPEPEPEPDKTPAPTPEPTPVPVPVPVPEQEQVIMAKEDSGRGSLLLIVFIVIILVALGVFIAIMIRRRGAQPPTGARIKRKW